MGTRNLTIVKSKGKTKVAQYGQWDGYPTRQGATIAEFLKDVNIDTFRTKVDKLKKWTQKGLKDVIVKCGGEPGSEWISEGVANKIEKFHPELSRNTGADVLNLIYNGHTTKVELNEAFKKDTLYCEYCYVIDLDDETVQVNDGKKYPFSEWTLKLMKKLEASEQ